MNSSGSAMKENETYVNSLQGHLSQLNSAWQELAKNTIDSDFIKGILATTTSLIKFTDEIGGLPVVLAAATSALMLFKGGLILDKVFGIFFKRVILNQKWFNDFNLCFTQRCCCI